MTAQWFVVRSGNGAPAFNMALDEALLESAPRLGRPVLRLYGWQSPAASFGYFQKYSEVERTTSLRPLVRRPTGGGLVPHDADWTYSVVFPARHEWHALPAIDSYRRVHEWLQRSFAELRVTTALAATCRKTAPGQCFAGHEKFDLLWQDRKIAGAAQRRTRDGLLIQGSIQPPLSLTRSPWETALLRSGELLWNASWQEWTIDPPLDRLAAQLLHNKHSRDSYQQER